MQAGSPEFGMVRTYLEWIVDLPWTARAQDSPDIAAVRAVLDADHYGLEKVKRRILEYLAVRKLKSDKKGPILCLIGPPGRRQDVARPQHRRARSGASSTASRSAACTTRPPSAGTGGRTSARCRATSSRA